ncbi:hypothetical protein FB451DRAFT_1403511 [Mycena latifolia]|nr:hypothetical protein FB451DRAFT_1403511 [Mycena latifolia]
MQTPAVAIRAPSLPAARVLCPSASGAIFHRPLAPPAPNTVPAYDRCSMSFTIAIHAYLCRDPLRRTVVRTPALCAELRPSTVDLSPLLRCMGMASSISLSPTSHSTPSKLQPVSREIAPSAAQDLISRSMGGVECEIQCLLSPGNRRFQTLSAAASIWRSRGINYYPPPSLRIAHSYSSSQVTRVLHFTLVVRLHPHRPCAFGDFVVTPLVHPLRVQAQVRLCAMAIQRWRTTATPAAAAERARPRARARRPPRAPCPYIADEMTLSGTGSPAKSLHGAYDAPTELAWMCARRGGRDVDNWDR